MLGAIIGDVVGSYYEVLEVKEISKYIKAGKFYNKIKFIIGCMDLSLYSL